MASTACVLKMVNCTGGYFSAYFGLDNFINFCLYRCIQDLPMQVILKFTEQLRFVSSHLR